MKHSLFLMRRLILALFMLGMLIPFQFVVPAKAVAPSPADSLFMANPDYPGDPDATPTILNSAVPAITPGYTLTGFDTTGFTLDFPPGDPESDETSAHFENGLNLESAKLYHCSAATDTGATAWFKFTPTTAGIYKISTDGSDYDTIVHVFKADKNSNLANRFADFDWDTEGESAAQTPDPVSCLDERVSDTENVHFYASTDYTYYISIGDTNPSDETGNGGLLAFSLIPLDTVNTCNPATDLCLIMENYFGEAFTDFYVRAFDPEGNPYKDSEDEIIVFEGDNGVIKLPDDSERLIITGADTYIVLNRDVDFPDLPASNQSKDVNIWELNYRNKVNLISLTAYTKSGAPLQYMDIVLAVNPLSEYGSLGKRPGTPRILTISTGSAYDIVVGDLSQNYLLTRENVDFETLPKDENGDYHVLSFITDPANPAFNTTTETITASFTGFDQTDDEIGQPVIDGYFNMVAPFTDNYWLWFAMDEDSSAYYPNVVTIGIPSYYTQPYRLQGSIIDGADLWQYYLDAPEGIKINIQGDNTNVQAGSTLTVNAPIKAGLDPAAFTDDVIAYYQAFDQFNNKLDEIRAIAGGAAPFSEEGRSITASDPLRRTSPQNISGFGADLNTRMSKVILASTRKPLGVSLTDNAGHNYAFDGTPSLLECVFVPYPRYIDLGVRYNLDKCTSGAAGIWTGTLAMDGGPLGTLASSTSFRVAATNGKELFPTINNPELAETVKTSSWTASNAGIYDTVDCTAAKSGSCSFRMNGDGNSTNISITKTISYAAGSTISFDFAYKTENARGDGTVKGRMDVKLSDGSTKTQSFVINTAANANFNVSTGNTDGWKTTPTLTYKIPSGKTGKKVTVVLENTTASGKVWFDSVNVKKVGSTSNLVANSSFEKVLPYGFSASSAYDPTQYADCSIRHSGMCSFHIGFKNINKYFTQTTLVNSKLATEGVKGNSVHVSFWLKGSALPATGGTYKLQTTLYYTDGTKGVFSCSLPRGTFNWTQVTCTAKSTKAFSRVQLRLYAYLASGQLWLDDFNAGIYK